MRKKLIIAAAAIAAAAIVLTILLLMGSNRVTGISLPDVLEVEKGQPVALDVTYTYKNENASEADKAKLVEKLGLAFTSDRPAVIVADDGSLLAAEGGLATVSVSGADGKLTASCTVTVTVPVEQIELGEKLALALNGEESAQLAVNVLPKDATDAELTWVSSDESVATVDTYGRVTAVAKGAATITATSGNGVSASCAVTVGVAPTGLSLNKEKITLTVGGSTALQASLAPEDADPTELTWASSNESVATVDANGKIKAAAKGEATITVTSENGLTASCTVTVRAAASSQGGAATGGSTGSQGSGQGSTGTTTPPQPTQPDPAPTPEPQHYHGNGSDWGVCPVCGAGYSPSVALDPDAGFDAGDLT